MRIMNNIASLNNLRISGVVSKLAEKSIEKLSSGYRINRAGDDAAGLSISEKMRAQIRGLNQASRNSQDGISLIQTAEGALSEVHEILQRGRELSVQAVNDTNVNSDREKIQAEIDSLLEEVNRIGETTEFNTIKLLDGSIGRSTNGVDLSEEDALKLKIIEGLKSGWLEEAESMIETHYGLTASTRDIKVVLEYDSAGGELASIQTQYSIIGDQNSATSIATVSAMELHIDLYDFDPSTGENGENVMTVAGGKMYNDRIIVHEMVHAMMADSMGDNFYDAPTWFKEGTAEFIHGADDRIEADSAGGTTISAIVTLAVDMINNNSWNAASANYSAGYLAVKYIEDNLSVGSTFADIMAEIKNDPDLTSDNTLDAIVNYTTFTSVATLTAGLAADGATFYNNIMTIDAGAGESDTGSIGGSDHTGVVDINAEDIVPTGTYSENPTNFNFLFTEIEEELIVTNSISFQVGANESQTVSISIDSVTTTDLRLNNVNVVNNADNAITAFNNAIESVSQIRSKLGAYQNRLDHTIKNIDNSKENLQSSESRIRDVDMAKEMMSFTKYNILSQAAQSMLAQSNQASQGVLQLLR